MWFWSSPETKFKKKIIKKDYYSALSVFLQNNLDKDFGKRVISTVHQKFLLEGNEEQAKKIFEVFEEHLETNPRELEGLSRQRIIDLPGIPSVLDVAVVIECNGLGSVADKLGVSHDLLEQIQAKYHMIEIPLEGTIDSLEDLASIPRHLQIYGRQRVMELPGWPTVWDVTGAIENKGWVHTAKTLGVSMDVLEELVDEYAMGEILSFGKGNDI